jgi:hypothetical protein
MASRDDPAPDRIVAIAANTYDELLAAHIRHSEP